jgi:hypothetical protein
MIVYINGIKASLADIRRLMKDMSSGLSATCHITKKGAIAFVTNN